MKKFLTYSVVVATIAWSMGISAVLPAAAAYTPTDGDLIKTAAYPAVYYVSGGKKYLFVNRVTFGTWRDDFSGLKVVSQADFDSISLGGNVTARPGVSLVKFDNSSIVYAVTPGAVLVKLADAAAQTALYGSAAPIIIQSSFEANYTKSSASLTATSNYPDGSLISNSGTTYLVMSGALQAVSGDAFTANAFKTSYVHSVSSISGYTVGSAITGKVSAVSDIVAGAGSSTVTGSATVALSSDTPASGTIVASQATADLAHFTFTGTGTVTGVKLTKIGVAGDTTLSNVYLYDGATRLTDAGSVSNGVVNFSNSSGLFTLSGSKVITVKADILTGTGGQTVGVSINSSADITGSTISGSFPVAGNIMSIATAPADIATATLGTASNVGTTVTAGTSNVTLWSNTLSTTQRNVLLKGVTFNQIGSMPNDSITNIKLYVDGTQSGTASIDSNGLLVFNLTASPVTLNTGSHTVDIRGDVVKGSSRTFKFSMRTQADIVLYDTSYGVNIAASCPTSGVTTGFPSEPSTGATTISSGTLSVTTDPSFNTTQIVSSASNQTLGKWIFKAYGEDMKVMNLYASSTALTGTNDNGNNIATTEKINNYSIFVNGAQVGSSKTYQLSTTTSLFTGLTGFGSTNLFTVPAGTSVTVELRGDLSLAASTAITSVQSAIQLKSGQVQGQTSYATTAIGSDTTYNALNVLNIATGVLSLAKNAAYSDQTIAPNTTAAKIGSFVLTASDADTVRVTNIVVDLSSNSTLGYATNTSNLYISENTTAVSPQGTNNFAVDFTMQPNTTKTIDVYLTIGNVSGADLGLLLKSALYLTARTGSNADASIAAASLIAGQQITVNSGTLAASSPSFATSSALTARFVVGGSTQDKAAVYNFKASNAPIILDEVAFAINSSAASTNPITSLIIYPRGSTQSWTLPINNNYGTTTGMSLTIPATYSGQDLIVKAVMQSVGLNAMASNVTATTSLTYIKYRQGSTIYTTYYGKAALPSAQLTAVASIPTLSVTATGGKLSAGTVKLANLTIGADAGGAVRIDTIAFKVTTSSKTSLADSSLSLRDGSYIIPAATTVTNATSSIAITGGYTVDAGTTKTLGIYGTVNNDGWTTAIESVNIGLADGSGLSWADINGNASSLTGVNIYGYTTDAVSISSQ